MIADELVSIITPLWVKLTNSFSQIKVKVRIRRKMVMRMFNTSPSEVNIVAK